MKTALRVNGSAPLRPWPGAALLLLIALLLTTARPAGATHIVGGQLQVLRTAPYTYEVGMTLYFDAINGQPGARDASVCVGIFERTTNRFMDSLTLVRGTTTPVNYGGVACQSQSVNTDEISYGSASPVYLNPGRYSSPNGYYLVWERCCRNGSITNIADPNGSGTAFYLEFPPVQVSGREFVNSSPRGFRPIVGYACVTRPFQAAFGGTDPDGDSLAYDLVTPLNGGATRMEPIPRPPGPGNYLDVVWLPGYDTQQQIRGPAPLRVDVRTGQITFTGNELGLFVFAVRCSEYRRGQKIGEVRREFQQLIVQCPTEVPPQLDLTQPGPAGVALPYVPGTIVQLPADPVNRCLNLYITSPDTTARVSMELVPLDTATVTGITLSPTAGTVISSRDTLLARICFPDKCFGADGQPHRFRLIVRKDACPQAILDSVEFRVQAPPIPDTPPRLRVWPAAGPLLVREGDTVAFTVLGYDADSATRVTVRCATLLAAPGATCPQVTAPDSATTRLRWPITCLIAPADYALRLTVSSENCGRVLLHDTTVVVRVLPVEKRTTLPFNVFTPNGDQRNDTFAPAAGLEPACGQTFRRLRIFSRWGREIFTSDDRAAAWTGADTAAGIYYYSLEYSDRAYKGWVELVR